MPSQNKKDLIHVLDGTVALKQPEHGLRTSIDAVLLAAACPAKAEDHILDLGCGVGAAGLCALSRINDTTLTGLDIQSTLIELADKNAEHNKLSKRCVFIKGNVQTFQQTGFDHVICNPPFEETGKHIASPHETKATASGDQESGANLEDWFRCALRAVKSGGSFTLIHKADQIQRLMQGFGKSWGATEIIPLWPKQDKVAKRVIIRTFKDRKSSTIMNPGLTLHNADGSYTREAEKILRGRAALL